MGGAELIDFASEFRAGILGPHPSFCRCFAVCAPLVTLLQMHGVGCEMVNTDLSDAPYAVANHFWIRLSDGRALDPTADQFPDEASGDEFPPELPPVYLGPPLAFHVPSPGVPASLAGRT